MALGQVNPIVSAPTVARSRRTTSSLVLSCILLLGIGGRAAYVYRPFDYRVVSYWHQADDLAIARNFYREGMNIFYPRIDWRGDTPGYAEMELPLLPWMGAALYRVFGMHVQVLRALTAAFEFGSLLLFAGFARQLLPPTAAMFAIAAFSFNPLLIVLATTIQPEPLMHFFSLLAMVLIWRWSGGGNFRTLLAASMALAVAILCKLPALALALVFAYFVIRRLGARAFTDRRMYIAGAVAFLPPLAWYVWAYRFWVLYGNSLGVTNESHFLGWDLLMPPKFLLGILGLETVLVFTPVGWLLMLAALRLPWQRVERLVVWYAAVFLFYVVTSRTTGARWAFYYHVLSVAPGCLLMGVGVTALGRGEIFRDGWAWLTQRQQRLGELLAAGTLVALFFLIGVSIYRRDRTTEERETIPMYTCALQFAAHVPVSSRIVVNGGVSSDNNGHAIAHNDPMMFAWMDRKGFNYPDEDLSIATLDAIAARGGRYWVVQRRELARGNLEQQADARYRRLAACDNAYYLYDLRAK